MKTKSKSFTKTTNDSSDTDDVVSRKRKANRSCDDNSWEQVKKRRKSRRKSVSSSDSSSSSAQQINSAKKKSPTKQKSASSLLETYKTENDLKDVSVPSTDLTGSDLFYVQIPKSLHPQLLSDATVSLDGKTKFRFDADTYIWDASDSHTVALNVIDERGVKRLQCKRIVVHEHFKLKHRAFESKQTRETVPFPANLRVRHPLFGTNYVEKTRVDEDVVEKLEHKQHRKRKRKVAYDSSRDENEIYKDIFSRTDDKIYENMFPSQMDGHDVVKKKKKKKKDKTH